MIRIRQITALGVSLVALVACAGAPRARAGGQGSIIAGNPAPSPEQIQSLITRAIANQHRDDRALEEFERIEHTITRKAENAEIITDLTERILPSATGNIKLKMTENGVPVSADLYRQELEFAVNAFELAMHPNDRYKEDLAKFEKRRHDHAELVDTAQNAFRVTWAGRETRTDSAGPRTLMKLLLDPDPDYKPINRFAASFQHVHAVLWVDEAQAQFARLEGDIATDITFGGGVAGKVYHGGHVVMVQEEVAPGIWLPTLYDYEVDGRKFVFAFGIHEHTEVTRYRRVGPPAQAIEIVRNELSNLTAVSPTR
jgi:hypothetical protein